MRQIDLERHERQRPITTRLSIAAAVVLLLAAVAVWLLGCKQDSSTTEPINGEVLTTQWLDVGYNDARALVPDIDRLTVDGMNLVVEGPSWAPGGVLLDGWYQPETDTMTIREHVERVIAHETTHALCNKLGHPRSCCDLVGHAHGFDLLCRPLP
jgi:hypothetical protein